MFAAHNWRHYEREVDVYLWGTENITLSSVGGQLVTFTNTADQKWVDQDVLVPGSVTPHTIVRINDTRSFIIDPAYSGASISIGTTATIRQVRCGLPCNFGSLLDPVLRDRTNSRPTSPHEMSQILRGQWGSSFCHSVQNKNIVIWPAQPGRLYFRFKFQPSELFEYGHPGTEALVQPEDPRDVIGSGSQWNQIPHSGEGSVFESDESISRGFPFSAPITIINDDDSLTLGTDWKSPLGTAFPYHISTDLDLPPYLVQYVIARSQFQSGKRDKAHVYQTLLQAMAADSAIEQRMGRANQGIVSMVSGSRD